MSIQTNQSNDLLAEWSETRSLLRARRDALAKTSAASRLWAATLNGWCAEIDALIGQDAKAPETATLHDHFLHDPQASVARTITTGP